MKKLMSMLLAVVMVFGLTACNGETGNAGGSSETPSVNNDEQTSGGEITLPSSSIYAEDEWPFPIPTTTGFKTQEDVLANIVARTAQGSITYGVGTTPQGDCFAGWSNNSTDGAMRDMIHGYGTLASTPASDEYEFDPVVVKEALITANEDGTKTYQMTINDNLKWSDGEPITAVDYVFSILMRSSPEFVSLDSTATAGLRLVGYNDFFNGETKTFTGVNLVDEYTFSVTVAADNLPYYYDTSYAGWAPFPIHVIAPGVTITDDGSGATISEEYTSELLQKTILDPDTGYRYNPAATCGPYKFISFDRASLTTIMEVNPYFISTYDGYKPAIQRIIFKYVAAATSVDELSVGGVDVLSANANDPKIKEIVDKETHKITTYPSTTISQLRFHCDIGAMQFKEVRQAIAWCFDRDEFALQLTDGYAIVPDSLYQRSSWIYQENKDWLEDNLVHYNLNLDKAREVLTEGGWVLNEKGDSYKEGTDTMRYKMHEGELMPLRVVWAANPNAADTNALIRTSLIAEAAKVGLVIIEESVQSVTAAAARTNIKDEDAVYQIFSMGTSFSGIISYWNLFQFEDSRLYASSNSSRIKSQILNDLALDMRATDPLDRDGYEEKWLAILVAINDELPNLYTYSNLASHVYTATINNYNPGTTWQFQNAVIRAYLSK